MRLYVLIAKPGWQIRHGSLTSSFSIRRPSQTPNRWPVASMCSVIMAN